MAEGRTHRPSHDADKCRACGVCTFRCPATLFDELRVESDSLRGSVYQARSYSGEQPEHPPCRLACPLQQDVPGYLSAVAQGDLRAAGAIVHRTNALPSVCGRVCIASCMRACTRAALDDGVDIRAIKRFASEASRGVSHELGRDCGLRIAIVGAGPAGLAAAHRARQLGAKVTIFEARGRGGGELVNAVAPFVLSENAVAMDIAKLVEQGLELRTDVRVGVDLSWSQLEQEHDAVIVATGAGRGVNPKRPGNALAGVTDVFELCRRDGLRERRIDGHVVVEGGGHAAIQAARTALRLGAASATIVHAFSQDQWHCGIPAIAAAQAEGVRLAPATRIVSLEGNAQLEGVSTKPIKEGRRDAVGRAKLLAVGKEEVLPASVFVPTIDRRPSPKNLPSQEISRRGPLGSLLADVFGRLAKPKWYAAGEAMTSAATVVDSMATGRRAAQTAVEDALSSKAGAR